MEEALTAQQQELQKMAADHKGTPSSKIGPIGLTIQIALIVITFWLLFEITFCNFSLFRLKG